MEITIPGLELSEQLNNSVLLSLLAARKPCVICARVLLLVRLLCQYMLRSTDETKTYAPSVLDRFKAHAICNLIPESSPT